MEKLFDWVYSKTGVSPLFQEKFLESLLIIVVLGLIRYLVLNLVYREIEDTRKRYRWRKSVTYILTLIGLFLVGRIWFQGFQSIATFFGIFAAGIAIALQDLLVNIAGWLFIMWRRPFDVGDRIEINEHAGDVIDRRLFMFTLMEIGRWVEAEQSTGRVIHIPNGWVFKHSLANYSRGFSFIWNEIPVLLTFESDWEKAKQILFTIANEHAESLSQSAEKRIKAAAKKYMIFYSKLTPIVWTSVKDSGVLLTMRYLCDPRKRRSSEQAIWESILHAFAKEDDIDFAYPTMRIYNNQQEGKSGAGGIKK
ncbi:mechanosensitive ion channel protein MscS [candidate division KSB1 bacterium 4484_87]|nr:MAG: mechanosensitive ion channel protein MscS [candidate division KSB1 bacterium 4484_87]